MGKSLWMVVGFGRSWSGKASGTKMGGEVMGMVEQGWRSLDIVVSLVSESVDHSSEVSDSGVSSSESAPGLDVALALVSWTRCLGLFCCGRFFVLRGLVLRNPIRLCGRGGTSGSLALCDMFVNKDLTSASYDRLLPLVGPPPSRGIFDYGRYGIRSYIRMLASGGSKSCCSDEREPRKLIIKGAKLDQRNNTRCSRGVKQ